MTEEIINDLHFLTFDCEYAGEDPNFKVIPPGYIDKTVCGCGLTSVAIEGDENCVIAVPNVSLVINKVKQYYNTQQLEGVTPAVPQGFNRFKGEVFGVYGEVDTEDIAKYINRVKQAGTPIKILTTYDSLAKCYQYLNNCHLIIDESDKIIGYMSMKVNGKTAEQPIDVVTNMLNIAYKYKKTVSFISATPIEASYLHDWVSEIDQYTLNWKNETYKVPIEMKRNKPFKALQDEIIRPLKKQGEVTLGDATFNKVIVFVNSVTFIHRILKECELDPAEVAIMCSQSGKNSILLRGYNIELDFNQLPKFTFLTSSGFQGIDLYDDSAMNVVVSSTNRDYQMVDINTDLIQAISRQRSKNNPNFNRYVYIYDQSAFADKNEEVLKAELEQVYSRISNNVSVLNKLKNDYNTPVEVYQSTEYTFKQSKEFRRYTVFMHDKYFVNDTVFNAEKYKIFETLRRYRNEYDIMGDIIGNQPIKPIVISQPKLLKELSYKTLYFTYKNDIDKKNKTIFDAMMQGIDISTLTDIEFYDNGKIKVDRNKFTAEQLATEYFNAIDLFYRHYGTFSTNVTYVKKMIKAFGSVEKQFTIEMKRLFKLGELITPTIGKERIANLYKRYDIKSGANIRVLAEFGYKTKRIKNDGKRFVLIEEIPSD